MSDIYCGPVPDPASLLSSWRLDVAAFVLVGVLIAIRLTRGGKPDTAFYFGCSLLLLLFLSPLCALSAALFSARAVHHLLLVAIVAPLLVLNSAGFRPGKASLFVRTCIFTILFWIWHVPLIYDVAVSSASAYWLMQGSLLASACLMWNAIFRTMDRTHALAALLSNVIQMGMLGALLTFSSNALYGPHLFTTQAFGFSPLEDQQLAGLIMWIPGAVPFVLVGLFIAAKMLDPHVRRLDRFGQR